MLDSLRRIKALSKEVCAVKLADRITNLQEPPNNWDINKKVKYQLEAIIILNELKGENQILEERLMKKITEYERYIN
jgi:guanosine-3',5'-bis(diphosphate) 3'-pyrophosphohydrolase